jgi:hypothetical protein
MTREFLSAPSAAPAPAARVTPVPAATPQQQPAHPLAGAFPAWDLLPAAPFVCRVK